MSSRRACCTSARCTSATPTSTRPGPHTILPAGTTSRLRGGTTSPAMPRSWSGICSSSTSRSASPPSRWGSGHYPIVNEIFAACAAGSRPPSDSRAGPALPQPRPLTYFATLFRRAWPAILPLMPCTGARAQLDEERSGHPSGGRAQIAQEVQRFAQAQKGGHGDHRAGMTPRARQLAVALGPSPL